MDYGDKVECNQPSKERNIHGWGRGRAAKQKQAERVLDTDRQTQVTDD